MRVPLRRSHIPLSVAAVVLTLAPAILGTSGQPSRQAAARTAGQKRGVATTIDTAHLTLETSARDAAVAPGTRFALVLGVTPKATMHVYAPGQEQYIPISLTIDADEMLTVHTPVYPQPEKFFFAPLKETQLVYTRPFRIVQDVTLKVTPATRDRAKTPGASLSIKGSVRYQACDHKVCYIPKNVPLAWTVALRPLE